jgi:ABC-type sugar transport system ATPase subunit
MNFFPAVVRHVAGSVRVESPFFSLALRSPSNLQDGRSVLLGIRPHDIRLEAGEDADVRARVDVVQPLGDEVLVYLSLPEENPPLRGEGGRCREPSGTSGPGSARRAYPAGIPPVAMVVPAESRVRVDDRPGLRFRHDRLYLFDAADGRLLDAGPSFP